MYASLYLVFCHGEVDTLKVGEPVVVEGSGMTRFYE